MTAAAAESEIRPFLLGDVRLEEATTDRDQWPDADAFGNTGIVTRERFVVQGRSRQDRGALAEAYIAAGYSELPRDSLRDDDNVRLRLFRLDPSDPFLLESEVEVGIGGRALLGAQRGLLERKLASLRQELDAPTLPARRRAMASRMVAELEAGLLPRVSVALTRRVFRPDPILSPGHSIGDLVPIRRLSQIAYTVMPIDPVDRDEDAAEPMYFTILGLDEVLATFMFTGGLHGQRTATDLEDGMAHHAWFQNRRNDSVEDTAPWIGRRIYRELASGSESEMIVRWERDEAPVRVRRTGEGTERVEVDGAPRDLPVLRAETEKDDRLAVLADPGNPLVLRLEEAEAELLRSIDAIRAFPE